MHKRNNELQQSANEIITKLQQEALEATSNSERLREEVEALKKERDQVALWVMNFHSQFAHLLKDQSRSAI